MNKNNKISNGTRKNIIFCLFVVFLLLATTKIVYARFFLPQFGGRVILSKALEIQALEMVSFQCLVLGSTFSIIPIGSPSGTPTSYFVPFGIFSKTGNAIRAGQLIMGKYNLIKTPIACTSTTVPPVITTVWLDTVTLYGNSR